MVLFGTIIFLLDYVFKCQYDSDWKGNKDKVLVCDLAEHVLYLILVTTVLQVRDFSLIIIWIANNDVFFVFDKKTSIEEKGTFND